ncbi:MAG: glycosyltransferase family 2 protein [Candidatus Heimdallarchaeota archaeon]
MKKISFIIPALNEEAAIGMTLDAIPTEDIRTMGFELEVLVVDNKSEDRTATVAEARGAKIVFEPERGYGHACKAGLRAASGDILILVDGDASYPIQTSVKMISLLQDSQADIVLGSRFQGTIEKGGLRGLNRFGNILLTFLVNFLFGNHHKLTDVHTGFRSFNRELGNNLNLVSGGMEFASELVVKALQRKLRICEIPINYSARPKSSYSKLNPFRDGLRHLLYLLQAKIRTVLGIGL